MTDLWREAENFCATIKHNSEALDLNDVRALLRRVQKTVEVVGYLLTPDSFEMNKGESFDGYAEHQVAIRVSLPAEQYRDLIQMMSEGV